jgi:hypothetical protein
LTGVKMLGIEVSLAESSVQTKTELVGAITEGQHFSGKRSIVDQIRKAIVRGDTEILEINLRNRDYWWSTRLYLLAALADDHSTIKAFAFVEHGIERKFLGLCTPTAMRKAIDRACPVLAKVYVDAWHAADRSQDEPIWAIVHSWTEQPFGKGQLEPAVVEKVSAQSLEDWLSKVDQRLSTDSIEWSGVSDPHLIRQILTEYSDPYVALIREGRLDRIVNRSALAIRVAERALKS